MVHWNAEGTEEAHAKTHQSAITLIRLLQASTDVP
jgi:hypothetical protein